jgi:RNA-binding protein 5/10
MAYAAQMSQMAAPPSSSFVYDPNSGYYYDASSGYFFHPQTQLYFHSQTQQYYRWDDATKQYAVVSSTSADQASSLPSESDQKTELNSNELELFPKKTSKCTFSALLVALVFLIC